MSTSVGVPKSARVLATLPHGDPVGALLFNSSGSHLYTGGKVLKIEHTVYLNKGIG